MTGVERIEANGALAIVVRAAATAPQTRFVTPDYAPLQTGFVVYPAGGEVARHEHLPIERSLAGTSEALFVREGRCELDLYDRGRRLVETVTLERGDAILLLAGGHGLRFLEDTVLLEIKQGPYTGLAEKERF